MKTRTVLSRDIEDSFPRRGLSFDGGQRLCRARRQATCAPWICRYPNSTLSPDANHPSSAASGFPSLGAEQSGIVSSKFNALPFPGPSSHHPFLLPSSDDPSSQDTPPGAWGAQHIHVEKSLLRRVQLGHGNEMSLPRDPVQHPAEEHPAGSFTGSPPGSMASPTPHTQKGPEASLCEKRSMMGNSFHLAHGRGTSEQLVELCGLALAVPSLPAAPMSSKPQSSLQRGGCRRKQGHGGGGQDKSCMVA